MINLLSRDFYSFLCVFFSLAGRRWVFVGFSGALTSTVCKDTQEIPERERDKESWNRGREENLGLSHPGKTLVIGEILADIRACNVQSEGNRGVKKARNEQETM